MSSLNSYGGYDYDRNKNAAGSGINTDAWGRQKVVNDQTVLHGMFTNDIALDKWREVVNGVEQTSFVNATSEDGKAVVSSTAVLNDVVVLETYRNPRYQPNRGYLYSTSVFLPNPTGAGERDFGFFTPESGVFFRQKADGLYACRRTKLGGIVQPDIEEKIETSALPDGYDPSKGNIYDIQMQWRGVGNIGFYIGDADTGVSKLVHEMALLNTGAELNTWNPANPIAFRCKNLGDQVTTECGCVDVSTEGGNKAIGSYGSISINNESGSIALTGFNAPVMAVRSKRILANGDRNTRDVLSLLATAYSDQRSFLRVWATRDDTAITLNDQAWSDFRDGHLEKLIYGLNPEGTALVGTPFTFDTIKADLIFGSRVDQDTAYATSALFEGRTDIYQTPGDIFIFTLHRETGLAHNGGVTYEFAEEI